jgi:3-phenylpropionate/cinnamic acid dioxygenase small subunit
MEDARHIENLIYRYAQHIDSGDLEAVAELFRHGAIYSPRHETRQSGYDEVLAMYQASCRIYPDCQTPKTKHLTTNVQIEVAPGGDDATAHSYYTVIQATDALPLQPIISGRYQDSFHKVEGNWAFRERAMFVDLMGDCTAHLLYDPALVS